MRFSRKNTGWENRKGSTSEPALNLPGDLVLVNNPLWALVVSNWKMRGLNQMICKVLPCVKILWL
jgi:hypothetical protein